MVAGTFAVVAVVTVVTVVTAIVARPAQLREVSPPGADPFSGTASAATAADAGSSASPPGGGGYLVVYPDGRGGTRTVTWTRPGSGLPWMVPDASLPQFGDAGDPTDGARDLRAALAAATGYSPQAPADQPFGTAGVIGRAEGRATAYRATVLAPSALRDRPASFNVVATRGGVTSTPSTFDYCGTWPSDRPGLGETPPVPMTEFAGPLTCSLTERPDGTVVVRMRIEQGRRHSEPIEPTALQLSAFTVRPDGTAVRATAVAPLDAGWDAPSVEAVSAALDDLVTALPYPTRD